MLIIFSFILINKNWRAEERDKMIIYLTNLKVYVRVINMKNSSKNEKNNTYKSKNNPYWK